MAIRQLAAVISVGVVAVAAGCGSGGPASREDAERYARGVAEDEYDFAIESVACEQGEKRKFDCKVVFEGSASRSHSLNLKLQANQDGDSSDESFTVLEEENVTSNYLPPPEE